MMDHPFKVGEKYRNRRGEYEVVHLDENDMTVRYNDGNQMTSTIELQARIWGNIQLEEKRKLLEKQAKKHVAKNPKRKLAFHGLEESDFKKGVAGTCWRARTALGGYLSQQMSDTTKYDFQSYAIYRRAEVHIVRPVCYEVSHKQQKAKYIFDLNEDYARCGFYIEKRNDEMDDEWDWLRFIKGLNEDLQLQEAVESAMEINSLHWEVYLWDQGGLVAEVNFSPDGLLWKECRENKNHCINWSDFTKRLTAIPINEWCDLHLCKHIDKKDAITEGLQVVENVTEVYRALLPLYEMSAKENIN
jgi:hypothetical protein